MPIIIENISDHDDLVGLNLYRLRINDKVIGEFTHERQMGLAECLKQAMHAAQKHEILEAFAKLTAPFPSEEA